MLGKNYGVMCEYLHLHILGCPILLFLKLENKGGLYFLPLHQCLGDFLPFATDINFSLFPHLYLYPALLTIWPPSSGISKTIMSFV